MSEEFKAIMELANGLKDGAVWVVVTHYVYKFFGHIVWAGIMLAMLKTIYVLVKPYVDRDCGK